MKVIKLENDEIYSFRLMVWIGLWYLTPLSAIFQLYCGSQYYRWMKPEYPEKTTNLSQQCCGYYKYNIGSTAHIQNQYSYVFPPNEMKLLQLLHFNEKYDICYWFCWNIMCFDENMQIKQFSRFLHKKTFENLLWNRGAK